MRSISLKILLVFRKAHVQILIETLLTF